MQKKFLTDLFLREESNVIAFGVPLGVDAAAELDAIRHASWLVEPFDINKEKNLLQKVKIFDDGDINLENLNDITKKVSGIISQNKIPLMLGGNHLSSLFALSAFPKDTKVIVFDAHGDLKDEYCDEKILAMNDEFFDEKINDATWLRRLAEKIDPKNIFLVGVRSMDEDEFEFIKSSKINYVTASAAKDKMNELMTALWHFTADSNVYVSVDVDVFDPSIAPAVDYPEPNGLLFSEFQKIIGEINGKVVGADVCCLKPIQGNDVTEFLAVKSVFEVLSLIK